MDEIMRYGDINTVEELTDKISSELTKAAISFVRIGYLLKKARDEDILKDSGYPDIYVYANTKFGLDKSQVSRFIRINDRFSIGGYSEQLELKYEDFGYSKLSIMLTLPDEINEELSPEYSKSEINAIKTEYEAEQKISDMEVMMEDAEGIPDEFIAAVVKELNDEHPEPVTNFHESCVMAEKLNILPETVDVKEAFMPDGDRTYNIRIPGQGRFMVNMKDAGITIVNMRATDEKSPLSWNEFHEALKADMETRTFKIVEEEKPEKKEKPKKVEPSKPKKEVAPVQQCTDDVPQEDKDDTESNQDPTEDTQSEEDNTQTETENEHVERVEGEIVKDEEPTDLEKQVCGKLHKIIDEVEAPEITNWGHIKDRLQDVIRDINLNF